MHEMGFWPVFSSPSLLPLFLWNGDVCCPFGSAQPAPFLPLFHSQVCDNKFSICNVRASELALADSDSWRILSLTSSLYDVASSNREVCDKWWRKITGWIMILGFEDSALLWHKKNPLSELGPPHSSDSGLKKILDKSTDIFSFIPRRRRRSTTERYLRRFLPAFFTPN